MGRLFIIPARDVPVAVILRRGPSHWYHLILWETEGDHFTHGAWFKGRIYEDECDLSPDGKLFVYAVHQGSRSGSSFTHAWTAISRPPWLHALVLWPQGTTYGGGGRFTAPRTLWGRSSKGTHPDFPVPKNRLHFTDEVPAARSCIEAMPGTDWSGYDHQGHMVYSRGDMLFRQVKNNETILADFSNLKPKPEPAPEWATRPL